MALRERVIATLFILTAALISMALYDNRRSTYAAGKTVKLGSAPGFAYLYRYIQVSTIVFALGGCLSYDRIFLDVHDNTFIFFCGLVIAAAGIGLFTLAKLTLSTNYSPCFDAFLPKSLTMTGPYRYVRHPIYVSNLLILIGAFVMSGSLWIVPNVIVSAYFYASSAIREENELRQRIAGYGEYQNSTGRFSPKLSRSRRVFHSFGG